ncbi:MAG: hypothetical protein ACREB9_07715 [Thermoplasmata archaeon]
MTEKCNHCDGPIDRYDPYTFIVVTGSGVRLLHRPCFLAVYPPHSIRPQVQRGPALDEEE